MTKTIYPQIKPSLGFRAAWNKSNRGQHQGQILIVDPVYRKRSWVPEWLWSLFATEDWKASLDLAKARKE